MLLIFTVGDPLVDEGLLPGDGTPDGSSDILHARRRALTRVGHHASACTNGSARAEIIRGCLRRSVGRALIRVTDAVFPAERGTRRPR